MFWTFFWCVNAAATTNGPDSIRRHSTCCFFGFLKASLMIDCSIYHFLDMEMFSGAAARLRDFLVILFFKKFSVVVELYWIIASFSKCQKDSKCFLLSSFLGYVLQSCGARNTFYMTDCFQKRDDNTSLIPPMQRSRTFSLSARTMIQ